MLSFIMILLVFNTLFRIFIAEQAITAMQMQYATLDAYHSGEKSPQKTTGNIFETTYVIVDDQFDIQYISASLYDLSEKTISKKWSMILSITPRQIGPIGSRPIIF